MPLRFKDMFGSEANWLDISLPLRQRWRKETDQKQPSEELRQAVRKELDRAARARSSLTNKAGTDAEMLALMGTNGAAWAIEFQKIATKLGYSAMDEGWLIGWFANAIEAGRAAGRKQEREQE